MFSAVSPELIADDPDFLVEEIEGSESALQCLRSRMVEEGLLVQPSSEGMAPVFVINLRGDGNSEEKDLHFDGRFVFSQCFYGFVSSSEEGTEFFASSLGHVDGGESTVPEFTSDDLRIDAVAFGVSLLAATVNISRVDHDRIPTEGEEFTMGGIAAASGFVGHGNMVIGKMIFHISQEHERVGIHRESSSGKEIAAAVYFP
jgi:hypothetical protein